MNLLLHLDGVRAEEELRERAGDASPAELERLVLAATGDKAQAEAARLAREHALLRAGRDVGG